MSLAQLSDIDFASAKSLDQACRVLASSVQQGRPVWPVAGCTDWMVEQHMSPVTDGTKQGLALDISRVPELRGIVIEGDKVRIGAAEPFLAMRRHPVLQARCSLLSQMASEVGAVQIQARGTLGGNLVSGSPAADGVTALMALDAQIVLQNKDGERLVPVRSFYTGYRKSVRMADELLVRVEFTLPSEGAHQLWRKVGTRKAQAISKVAVAALAEVGSDGLVRRVGFGVASVAERVLWLPTACQMLLGAHYQKVNLEALEAAVDKDIHPIDDLRSTERYRRYVTRVLVRRFWEDLQGTT